MHLKQQMSFRFPLLVFEVCAPRLRDRFRFPITKKGIGSTNVLGMFPVKRLGAGNTMADRRQSNLIVFERQNDLGIAVQAHRFAYGQWQHHPTVTGHLYVERLSCQCHGPSDAFACSYAIVYGRGQDIICRENAYVR